MGRHLSREKLQGLLLREQVSREELRDLLDHLFEACPECGELASDLRSTPAAGTHPLVERALCRGEERRLQMIRWQAVARAELAELLELPPARRRKRIERAFTRFRNPALVELLLEENRRRVTEDPESALQLAETARDVALRLSESEVGRELAMTLLAQSHMLRGNSLRAQGEIRKADEVLSFARQMFEEEGNSDPLVEAELAYLFVSLRSDQRRFAEAARELARAQEIYERCQERRLLARTLVKKGVVLFDAGEVAAASEALDEALPLIDGEEDPKLRLMAVHNGVDYLVELGDCAAAAERLRAHAELYDRFPDVWTQARRHWVEAKVARGLGRPAEAEKLYLQVQSMFAAGGQAFQAALAGLELSLLQVEQGRMVEARKLAAEIVPAFLAQDIRREALAAVLVYEDAARREVLTTAVVHETLRALSRAPFAAASA